MTDENTPGPVPVCLVTTRATCKLIIRATTPGKPIAWPMLVADPCPYPRTDKWGNLHHHGHAHFITEPAPWIRLAPCNRQPYLLQLAA